MKKLGEVFNDYESGGTIRCAEIEKVTLRKKSKALELKITSNQYIEIKEIERFNNFLKERFLLNDAKVLIKYTEDVNKKPIVKKYQEVASLKYTKNDAKTLKALDADFDVIIFKTPGLYRVRYFLQDKAGYSYYAYTKITVDNIYGVPEGSKYETLWKKV